MLHLQRESGRLSWRLSSRGRRSETGGTVARVAPGRSTWRSRLRSGRVYSLDRGGALGPSRSVTGPMAGYL